MSEFGKYEHNDQTAFKLSWRYLIRVSLDIPLTKDGWYEN